MFSMEKVAAEGWKGDLGRVVSEDDDDELEDDEEEDDANVFCIWIRLIKFHIGNSIVGNSPVEIFGDELRLKFEVIMFNYEFD